MCQQTLVADVDIPNMTRRTETGRMKTLLIVVSMVALSAGVLAADGGKINNGSFEGKVIVEWLDDPFVPTMRLVEPFAYRQPQGKVWAVPGGHLVKGRGLPPLFRDLIGQPFNGGFRKSSIVYDYVTQKMTEPWEDAQHMFLDATGAEGVTQAESKAMYMLLRAQGSRWEVPDSTCYGHCHGKQEPLLWRPVVDETVVGELLGWVRRNNPPLSEIDERVQSAILDPGPHVFPQQPCRVFSGSTLVKIVC